MLWLGDVNASSMVEIPFNTTAIAGESITIATNGTIAIYKDGSTTERSSANGITFTEDHDTHVGTHLIRIDLSDNTDVGFYAAGSIYKVKYHTATIDGKSINAWVGMFSIDKTNQKADISKISTDATAADNLEALLDGTGGVTLVASAFTLTTPIIANATQISSDSVAADNAESFFDGTGYAGTNNTIPSVTTVTGNVNGTINGFTASAKAEIELEVNDALVVQRLDELLNADSDIDGLAPPTVGSVFFELLTKTTTSFTYDQTTDSLEAIKDNLTTDIAGVQSDTNDIQTRIPAALVAGRMDASVGAMAASVITAAATAADVVTELQSGLATSAALATAQTDISSILADTGTDGVVVAAGSKTGYSLASSGLDSVATTAPVGVAANFREMMVQGWRRMFAKSTLTATELKTYADNGTTVITTQTVSDSGGTQTINLAT